MLSSSPPSSDLEYLTGLERDLPSFGQSSYAHGWVTGAFIAPGREPLYVLPRMFVAFHLWGREPGELVTVNETDDGQRALPQGARVARAGRSASASARAPGASRCSSCRRPRRSAELVNATPLVNELRRVKSPAELELMTQGLRDRRRGDGRQRAARAAGRDDGRPRRGGRAPAAHPRLAHPVVPDAPLQLRLRALARLAGRRDRGSSRSPRARR